MNISLFKHNQIAYNSAVSMLEEKGRSAVIHPTGTGKSFIGFNFCVENPDKIVFWLSPSEYIFKTQIENLKKVTGGEVPENIVFCTYAKLMYMPIADIEKISADYIILDEFHRCGAEMWGKGVENLLKVHENAKILGLSATNIRYLDNGRDMAEELFDGNIASEMTLGEAIVRGILNPPTYVTAVYGYENNLEKYENRVRNSKSKIVRDKAEKYIEALRRTLDKADGLDVIFEKHLKDKSGKYLVFCASKEHMDEMAWHAKQWFSKIDAKPHVYKAYSYDPETSKEFASFKADNSNHLKLLFCIDMLNEGVHIENVSGVILFRPTVSPIIYKQQIGRAMSASKEKNTVILDIVDNISSLYSVGAIQEEMNSAINMFNFYGDDSDIVNESFEIIDEVKDCREIFDRLEGTLYASWNFMFGEAEEFFKANGHLLPEQSYFTKEGYPLGQWIVTQRGIKNGTAQGVLTAEQITLLENIGMSWEKRSKRLWMAKFEMAKAYFEKHGNLAISNSQAEADKQLSNLNIWLNRQRLKYKTHRLLKDEFEKLNKIGMVWELQDSWQSAFNEAEKFYQTNGHLDIPATFVTENGTQLGNWYRGIKSAYQSGNLSKERITGLEQISMQWQSVNERAWQSFYTEAEKYFAENGNLIADFKYKSESGAKLGIWIYTQRTNYKKGALSAYQIESLEKIGMVWQQLQNKWNTGYEYSKAYYAENNNINVPLDFITEDGYKLGVWVLSQRNKYKANKLKKSEIAKLEELDITWSPAENAWQSTFEEAKKFYIAYGNLKVPATYITSEGLKLKSWLANQKNKLKNGKLTEDRKLQLQELGLTN
ncbi:MAG: Helicase associated domain protein [Bacillota bacterium]